MNQDNLKAFEKDVLDVHHQYQAGVRVYNDWVSEKKLWEASNGYSNSLDANVYTQLSGNGQMPTIAPLGTVSDHHLNQISARKFLRIQPSVEVSMRISKADATQPARFGVGVYGNVPMIDYFSSENFKTDFKHDYNNLVKARAYINF